MQLKRPAILSALLFILIGTISLPQVFSEENIDLVERVASLEEDEIDIGRVCLLFAKEAYPDLDVDKYSRKIDEIVDEIRKFTKATGNVNDPDHRIRIINTYLYLRRGFHYDKEDPYGHKLKNRYINGLLDTKSGSCLTMPLLYLAIAQRLGYPVYPVSSPQHIFLRYVDPNLEMQNIESTNGGGYSSDQAYISDMEIPNKGIETGAYLRTMTYKELLAELFIENAGYWAKNHNSPKAIRYWEESFKLNPRNAEVYRIMGNHYFYLAKYEEEKSGYLPINQISRNPLIQRQLRDKQSIYRKQLESKGEDLLQKAKELGAAPPLPRNYWMIQEKNRREHKLSKGIKP